MKVLQVSVGRVYPPTKGSHHRKHGLVKAFPDLGDEVTRYCFSGDYRRYVRGETRREIAIGDGYTEIRRLDPLLDITKLPVLFGHPLVAFSLAFDRYVPRELVELADEADVVVVEEPWQVAGIATRTDTPTVYSSHNVETEYYEHVRRAPAGRWAHAGVTDIERRALDTCDALVCTSDRDRTLFEETYGVTVPVVVSPNGTDRDVSPAGQRRSVDLEDAYGISDDDYVAVFLGSNHPPNVAAAKRSLRVVARARQDGCNLQLLLLGDVRDAVETDRSYVTAPGYVDDLDAHLSACDLALNPSTRGGGTNVKMFDYFASGLAVVTTPFGARGIDVTDGVDSVVRDVDEFDEAVRTLLTDATRRRGIGERAAALVRESYTWNSISRSLNRSLRERFG